MASVVKAIVLLFGFLTFGPRSHSNSGQEYYRVVSDKSKRSLPNFIV